MGANLHAIERAWERYGLRLEQADLRKIGRLIRERKSMMTRRQGDGREVHTVRYLDCPAVVLWDARGGAIVTFLPIEEITSGAGYRRMLRTIRKAAAA